MFKIASKIVKYYVGYKFVDFISGGRVSRAVSTVTRPAVDAVKKVGAKISS